MAKAAPQQNDDGDIPLIEEQVETGLVPLLENYKPHYTPGGSAVDELEERFRLLPNQKLTELTHAYADAYAATDNGNPSRQIYAMVCDPNLPYRSSAAEALEGFANQNITVPLAAGTVKCSHLGESRYVMFFDKPQGTSLADIIATQRIPEHKIADLILRPICAGLAAMKTKNVHHGNLRPGAVFLGETTVLGECFSAPSGTLGHYLYEPLERLMADPIGHGEANEKADMYALAIIVFELMFGLDKLKAMPRQEFIEKVMRQGAYQVFSQGRDFPDQFQDFFRGILNDNTTDRWGIEQLSQYLGGKRFNMIAPTPPKDAARAIVFGEEQIFSRRVLANALHRNWKEAVRDIKALRIDRWCDLSLHRPELAEKVERAMRSGSGSGASERQVSDMMMRIFTLLDPQAPIRSKSLSLRPDAMGTMLAATLPNKGPELAQLLSILQGNMVSFWAEQADLPKNSEASQAIWQLKRITPYLEFRSLGFGIERLLYELNPSLPCQSPLLKPYHITTVPDALLTLDALAKTLGTTGSPIDRHIAAFIAAKIDITKEIRLTDYTNIPALAESQELVMLWLLSKAQQRHAKLKLVGLAAWAGIRVEKMLDQIHNRVIRKRQKLQLKKLASSGNIREVLMSILNREVIANDLDGFSHAVALHDINHKRIEFLQTPLILEYKARKAGGRMAVRISFTALTITAYITLSNLFGI